MSNLYTVLQQIQEAPGMFLGRPSVSDLFMFLNGYEFARSQMGVELDEDELLFFDGFQPWLQEHFGVQSAASWAKLIMLSCADERSGFHRFFGLLDEFLGRSEQQEGGLNVVEEVLR
ncbi:MULTISPECIES: hypothetical protein [Spirulina sp. CCY15215]|uniref:hypothetical protein n=1 Tax=Spirulina sp. CCY15215 TaxID=2767591 RepID=UPI0019508E75|nr:hypothetical protein [Spirulina major]